MLPLSSYLKKAKVHIYSLLLFLLSFLISFYRATDIQGQEDFIDSRASLLFLQTFSAEYLMYEPHNGMEFFAIPFYFLFGFNLFSLRLAQSIFLSLGIVLFFLFSRNHFEDEKSALVASLLLVSFPFFILLKYWPEYSFMAFFSMLTIYLFSLIKKKESYIPLILFAFFLGLGTYRKIILGPLGAALLFSYLIIDYDQARIRVWNFKRGILASGFFFVGLTPFIVFNLRKWSFLEMLIDRGSKMGWSGVFFNFQERFFNFVDLFVEPPIFYYGEIFWIGFAGLILFIASSFYIIYKKDRKNGIFLLATAFYFLFTNIGIARMQREHFYIVVPLLIIIMAGGVFQFSESLRRKQFKIVMSLILPLMISLNFFNVFTILATDNHYNNYFVAYELGHSIQGSDIEHIYVFTRDETPMTMNPMIYFTSGGRTVYYAEEILEKEEGEVKIIDRNKQFLKDKQLTLEDALKDAQTEKNIYFDSIIINPEWKEIIENEFPERIFSQEYVDQRLGRKDYLKFEIPIITGEGLYLFWVHESQNEIINRIGDLKKEAELKMNE